MAVPAHAPLWERVWYYALRVFCVLVFVFLVAPVFVIWPMSFSSAQFLEFPPPGLSLQWYDEYFHDVDWLSATRSSFMVALAATVCATVLGTVASMGIVRGRFRGKNLLMAFLISPMVIPLIITATGLYFMYSQLGWVESFHGMVIAHTVLATPFVVVVVSATLQGFDPTLERAAASLGASPVTTFFRVTFPVIAPGVVSGALFAFITSFDEVVVALFLSGIEWRTIPVKMFEGIRYEINPTITAVATMVTLIAVFVLTTVELLRRRSERLRGIRA
ncbi:MAG: ABC transporter permease [Alphaproteobacteria bacterium]